MRISPLWDAPSIVMRSTNSRTIFRSLASGDSIGGSTMENTTSQRCGFEAHQVFWSELGSIICACCHIPYPGSDAWVWQRREEITPEMTVEIEREGGQVACEGCGNEPHRIVR
jgi:hypothetical protein